MTHADRVRLTEDYFAASRMSLGGHLEELRRHLWKAIIGLVLIMLASFGLDGLGYATNTNIGIARPVMQFIGAPVEQELRVFHGRRKERALQVLREKRIETEIELDLRPLAEMLGRPEGNTPDADRYTTMSARLPSAFWSGALDEIQRCLGDAPSLKTFNLTEAMMVYFKVALACGVVLGSPWIFWQLWSYVAAGLYPHEKRLVHVYLPCSVGLFLVGVLFCQFLVMPRAVGALLWFNEWLGFQPELRLSEWLSFAILMPLVFGASFQLPLVMSLTERIGAMDVQTFCRHRRLAWFLIMVAAAVLTPTPDAVSLLMLWVPMGLLYELGILLCRLSPRRPLWEGEVDAAEELIEL